MSEGPNCRFEGVGSNAGDGILRFERDTGRGVGEDIAPSSKGSVRGVIVAIQPIAIPAHRCAASGIGFKLYNLPRQVSGISNPNADSGVSGTNQPRNFAIRITDKYDRTPGG